MRTVASAWIVGPLLWLTCLANLGPSLGQDLSEPEYRRLLEQLKPSEDELWRTIPWRINLLDAQRDSAGQQKPIFIWAMDGHPLGCT